MVFIDEVICEVVSFDICQVNLGALIYKSRYHLLLLISNLNGSSSIDYERNPIEIAHVDDMIDHGDIDYIDEPKQNL